MPSEKSTQHKKPKSYEQFCQQVYHIVRLIPPGRVMTYGGIAALIPKPEDMDPLAYTRIRARWVGYALKACPEDVPWWRVVNAKGQVSQRMGHGPHIQPIMLEEEGLQMQEGVIIHLNDFLWKPETN